MISRLPRPPVSRPSANVQSIRGQRPCPCRSATTRPRRGWPASPRAARSCRPSAARPRPRPVRRSARTCRSSSRSASGRGASRICSNLTPFFWMSIDANIRECVRSVCRRTSHGHLRQRLDHGSIIWSNRGRSRWDAKHWTTSAKPDRRIWRPQREPLCLD